MAINTGKVVTGGLLAGLVFNICDFVTNTVILVDDNRAMFTRLGLDPAMAESVSAILPWVIIDFVFGILTVWTYAAIRPRFGPGPHTAVTAGLIPFLGVTLVLMGFTSLGVFAPVMFVKGTIAALVSTILGSLAGGWAYKEA